MDEIAMLTGLVARRYGAQAVLLQPLNSENGKRIYRVKQASGQGWVLDESQWWWKRYNAAEEIAERARKRFEMYL